MPTPAAKRRIFRELHARGCFVIPNPYDRGSSRYLQHLGFKALATTSAGAAWSLGLPDRAVSRDVMLDHIRDIAEATDLPVNADFGNAFADRPEDVAENVRLCLATGVAGLSVEDQPADTHDALYDVELAVERVRAARAAIDAEGSGAVLVARSEAYMVRHPDAAKEALRRFERFAEAGADCLYAPGVRSTAEIADMVRAAGPKAVNILVGGPMGLTVADLASLGPPDQRRRGARARRLGRHDAGGRGDRDKGTFAALAKRRTTTRSTASSPPIRDRTRHDADRSMAPDDQPIGPPVEARDAPAPGRSRSPVAPASSRRPTVRDGDALFDAVRGDDSLWTYMGYGPADRAAFDATCGARSTADPLPYGDRPASGAPSAPSP